MLGTNIFDRWRNIAGLADALTKHSSTLFQPAEKQLAATTTELAGSGSPLRFLPVLGALLSVVLLG